MKGSADDGRSTAVQRCSKVTCVSVGELLLKKKGVRVSISMLNCWPWHGEGSARPAACYFSSLWIGLKRKVIAKGTWVGVRWHESGRKKMGGSDHKKKLGLWSAAKGLMEASWAMMPVLFKERCAQIVNQRLMRIRVTSSTHTHTQQSPNLARCHFSNSVR